MPIVHSAQTSAGLVDNSEQPRTQAIGNDDTAPVAKSAGKSATLSRVLRIGYLGVLGLLLVLVIAELGVNASIIAGFRRYRLRLWPYYLALSCAVLTLILTPILLWSLIRQSALSNFKTHIVFIFPILILSLAAAAGLTDRLDGGLDCSVFIGASRSRCTRYNSTIGLAWAAWIVSLLTFIGATLGLIQARRRGNGHGGFNLA